MGVDVVLGGPDAAVPRAVPQLSTVADVAVVEEQMLDCSTEGATRPRVEAVYYERSVVI